MRCGTVVTARNEPWTFARRRARGNVANDRVRLREVDRRLAALERDRVAEVDLDHLVSGLGQRGDDHRPDLAA